MSNKNQQIRQYTAEEREELVAAYRQSGLPQTKWCESSGVALSTLGRWLTLDKKVQKSDVSKQGWAQVSVVQPVQKEQIVLKAGKISIEISQDTDMKLLSGVLSVLVPLC